MQEDLTNKPKFMSKEERQKMALEKRSREIQEKRKQQEQVRHSTQQRFNNHPSTASSSREIKVESDIPPVNDHEMQMIKSRLLGAEKVKRKIRKMNDKRFVFDWDDQEDTSQDANPLYANRQSSLLFGRGTVAGIDENEQIKNKTALLESMMSKQQNKSLVERTREMIEKEKRKSVQESVNDQHWSEKPLNLMKERDWRIFKEDFSISTKGGNIPHPLRSWDEASIPQTIKDIIVQVGYTEPTPIQRQAVPIELQNRDIIGVAETGSGKTASFLIPMLSFFMDLPPITDETAPNGPYGLILAPTRELAQQIEQEAVKFCSRLNYRCVSIVGGRAIEEQAYNLRNGAELVIATPGRLVDCLDRRILVLNQCTYVVMDEADRMVDMGFEADVNFILDALPVSNVKPDTEDAQDPESLRERLGVNRRYRQTVMFSATMPPAVERLAKKYLRRPAVVTIGTAGQAVDRIEQRVELVADETRKKNRLIDILNSGEFEPPILVFVNLKGRCDYLAKSVEQTGYRTAVLHGGKNQEQREAALGSIKSGHRDILIATDVAGRGIDIKDVSLVINFDMAKSIEDYTHRIGRTGRAGKTGVAITFLSGGDEPLFYDLKQMLLKSSLSKVPRELMNHEATQSKGAAFKKKSEETLYMQ